MTKKKKSTSKPTTPSSPKAPGKPRIKKNVIPLANKEVAVYASPRISKALEEVIENMPLYHGVRLSQLFDAVYNQGLKDGARLTIDKLDGFVGDLKKSVPHRNPGQPRKKKKK